MRLSHHIKKRPLHAVLLFRRQDTCRNPNRFQHAFCLILLPARADQLRRGRPCDKTGNGKSGSKNKGFHTALLANAGERWMSAAKASAADLPAYPSVSLDIGPCGGYLPNERHIKRSAHVPEILQ